ncbi:MAG TPA: superoxide dismutase family protein [Acidimicrobiales bacterium]|nr:superoxide dismutase family protein [Acidimicrobiales bacterium]
MASNPLIRTASCIVAVAAAIFVTAASPSGALAPTSARAAGELRDLQTATAQPTDNATAQVTATESAGSTTVTLKVQGIDHAAAGSVLGAHVHSGTCIEGNGAAAGPHYNTTGGQDISDETEVWLDITVQPNGTGYASATVPFTIPSGAAGSVVIHALHTDHVTGAAGSRWACLPVAF